MRRYALWFATRLDAMWLLKYGHIMTNEIDYKKLLTHYMAKVIDCESISYVDSISYRFDLSPYEVEQLEEIEKEARKLVD